MSKLPRSRRSVLRTLGAVGIGAAGLGARSAGASGAQETNADGDRSVPSGWSSHQFDAANTGYNPDGAALETPMYAWRTGLGRDVSRPVVGAENVYTAELGSQVTALDRRSGSVRWLETVDGEVDADSDETAMALAGGTLFAVLGSCVYAFDAADGTIRWSRQTDDGELSAPTVAAGSVFLAAERGAFFALRTDTGETRWRVEDGVESINTNNDSRKAPAVSPDGSAVYFVDGHSLYSLDPAAGTERWRVDVAAYMAPVVDDAVYVTGTDGVRAYAPADGNLRWECEFDESVETAPVVADGRVFVQHYPRGVRALDANTGETLWTADLPLADHRLALVAGADALYVPVQSVVENGAGVLDELVALDPADGSERWRFTRRYIDTVGSEPIRAVATDDALYAVIDDRDLYRIDERPEGVRWRAEIGHEPDRVAVAGDGVIYAASTSGEAGGLAAVDPASGEQRWEVESDVVGRPVANDDYCFYADPDHLVALDPADGAVAWRERFRGDVETGVRLHDGTLYVGWGSPGRLYAVDAADGSRIWETAEGDCDTRIDIGGATPAVVGDTVFAEVDGGLQGYATADGTETCRNDQRVYALTGGPDVAVASWRGAVRAIAPDGTVQWTRDLASDVTGLQAIGGAADDGSADYVVARTVGSPASHYRALSLADGSTAWEFTAEEGPISMPTTADGIAYAATAGGHLHALDPSTGDLRETYDAFHGLHDRPAVVDGTVAAPSDEGFVYGFESL